MTNHDDSLTRTRKGHLNDRSGTDSEEIWNLRWRLDLRNLVVITERKYYDSIIELDADSIEMPPEIDDNGKKVEMGISTLELGMEARIDGLRLCRIGRRLWRKNSYCIRNIYVLKKNPWGKKESSLRRAGWKFRGLLLDTRSQILKKGYNLVSDGLHRSEQNILALGNRYSDRGRIKEPLTPHTRFWGFRKCDWKTKKRGEIIE